MTLGGTRNKEMSPSCCGNGSGIKGFKEGRFNFLTFARFNTARTPHPGEASESANTAFLRNPELFRTGLRGVGKTVMLVHYIPA